MPCRRRSLNMLAAALWAVIVCVARAMTLEVFEVAQEFIAATQVDNITNFFTQGSHCTFIPGSPYTLYILEDFSLNGNTCLTSLQEEWTHHCLSPPTEVFLVHSITYSPPLVTLNIMKTHIAALAHFLALPKHHYDNHHAVMVLDQSLQCLRIQHDATSTLATTLDAMALPANDMALLSTRRMALLTESPGMEPDSEQDYDHPTTAYVTTKQLLNEFLLEHMMTASTLQEYSNDKLLEGGAFFTLGQLWHQLLPDLNSKIESFPIFEGSVSKPLSSSDSSSAELQYRTKWRQRDIFMIALGDSYFSAIDWPRLTRTLKITNPGYTIHVYGDEEVEEFLEVNFPSFVGFYQSHHLRYFQWKSDFVRYLLLYEYGGVYLDLDHKLVMSFDKLLDSIQSSINSFDTSPKHVFVQSVNPGCIHNGFIMTNTIHDELFLALAGQIYLTTEAEALDYGLNTRNLYGLLEDLYGPFSALTQDDNISVDGLKRGRDLFLLQEVKLSSHVDTVCNTTGACKYGIKINSSSHMGDFVERPSGQAPPPHSSPPGDRQTSRRHALSAPSALTSRLVMYSNGLPNWSPKLARQVFLSS